MACARSLSSVTIVPPVATAPDQVSRDYTACRQQAQESSTAYVPAGDLLAAVRRVRTNDSQFVDCLKIKGYSVTNAQRNSAPAPSEPSPLSPGLSEATLQRTIYDVVLAGKSCRAIAPQSIECRYTVGKDLRFTIARIRETDATLSFIHSDHQGDFYADLGRVPSCIRIARGLPSAVTTSTRDTGGTTDDAFVSIRTGTIYRNAEDCRNNL
ncbi:hypothetical protein ACO9S2_17500 [Nitrospira sp. NS4]|uniref:hypothetical protein n=1 Tax=Nitrospira sp. NS4 TaxID=3414498 RepID=UPI003C2C286F